MAIVLDSKPNNTDRILFGLKYNPLPLLRINGTYEYIRRGDLYVDGQPIYKSYQTFLYGDRSYYSVFDISIEYEIVNNLFYDIDYTSSRAWGKSNLINIGDYNYKEFTAGMRYGF